MSVLFRFPRTTLLCLVGALLSSGAFVYSRLDAAVENPQIVFLRLTDGYWQLWTMDVEGQKPHQLTTSPVDKHSPSWCPGNEVVSFSTSRGDNFLLELATGKEHPQRRLPSAMEPPKDLDGNPLPFDVDVRQLLVDHGYEQFARLACGDESGPPNEVVEVRAPAAFREGSGIVVQRRYTAELKPVYEINVAELTSRASIEASSRAAEASAKGRRVLSKSDALAYVSDRTGGDEIWSLEPNEIPEALTDLAASVGNPFWSHDGNYLYFESNFEGSLQIYRVLADGEGIERVSDGIAPSRSAVLSWPAEEGKE